MPRYIHVDVETTSTNTAEALVISIGAVDQESGEEFHGIILDVDDNSIPWDKGTWDWWHSEELKRPHDRLVQLYEAEERSPFGVAKEFVDWVAQFGENPTFCAWPASFDYPLVVEFLHGFDLKSPFHYRTLDVKSYLCGKLGVHIDAPRTAFPDWCELAPVFEHDALSDAIAQMKVFKRVLELP